MPRVLTLDASMAVCSAGLVEDGVLLGSRQVEGELAALPSLVEKLLGEHGRTLDLVAVIVGPGSFTGLRASIALAHGIALAAGVPVLGVTVGAALTTADGTAVWVAVDSKRGRVFLERDGAVESAALDALPSSEGPIALGGDAALAVGEMLAGRGADIHLMATLVPEPLGIARAALAGRTALAQPIYVDPPAARPGRTARAGVSPIEPATAFYAEPMALIHAASFQPGERWGQDAITLQLELPGAFGFIALDGGFVLARVAADESEILTLAVDPAVRRGGLGRRLVERARSEAGARGAGAMFLEVAETNEAARALYAAFGFVEIGRRPRYYAGNVDALVLRTAIPCGSRVG